MGYEFFFKAHGKSGVPFLVYHTDIFVKINKNLLAKKKMWYNMYKVNCAICRNAQYPTNIP